MKLFTSAGLLKVHDWSPCVTSRRAGNRILCLMMPLLCSTWRISLYSRCFLWVSTDWFRKKRMILSLYITFPLALATLRIRSLCLQSKNHIIKVLGVAEFKPLLESEIRCALSIISGERCISILKTLGSQLFRKNHMSLPSSVSERPISLKLFLYDSSTAVHPYDSSDFAWVSRWFILSSAPEILSLAIYLMAITSFNFTDSRQNLIFVGNLTFHLLALIISL